MRLIDPDGALIGVVPLEEARARAEELGLDLVEVNPNVRPIACRIMDYGRFKYDKQKKERKAKTIASDLKQIKFRPAIDDHDFDTKTDKLRRFLAAGFKCRVTIMFRKREMRRPENGVKLLQRVVESLADVGRSEGIGPMLEGSRDLTVTINPLRQPARKPEKEASDQPHRLRRHERLAAVGDGPGGDPAVDDLPEDDSNLPDEPDDDEDDDAEG